MSKIAVGTGLVLTLFLGMTKSAEGAILLSDDFSDGNASSATNGAQWYFYSVSSLGTLWTVASDSTLNSVSPNKAFRNGGGSAGGTVALAQFSPVTLTSGMSLQLSFGIRNTSATPTSGFLVYLLNNAGVPITGNSLGGTNPVAADSGYNFTKLWTGTGSTFKPINAGAATSTNNTDSMLLNDNGAHAVIFTIADISDTLQLTAVVDGVTIATTTYSSPVTTTFDTLELQLGGGNVVDFSNITVSTSAVPEPPAAAFLLLGTAWLWRRLFRVKTGLKG